jgi:hypothetical protein
MPGQNEWRRAATMATARSVSMMSSFASSSELVKKEIPELSESDIANAALLEWKRETLTLSENVKCSAACKTKGSVCGEEKSVEGEPHRQAVVFVDLAGTLTLRPIKPR